MPGDPHLKTTSPQDFDIMEALILSMLWTDLHLDMFAPPEDALGGVPVI